MPNLGSPFKGGHKFPNGLPMTDDLYDTLNSFYLYAVQQGCTQSKEDFFKKYENLLRRFIGKTNRNFS